MKRWALLTTVLAVAVLAAMPAAADAQAKDTLVVALTSHAPTLDPHMHFERVGILVNINMFDSLLHRNTKLEFEPSLATSWKALSDTQWEFKLRKGVRFHNGDIMTRRTSSTPSTGCSTRRRNRPSTATSAPSRKCAS